MSLMDCLSFSARDFFFGNSFDKILLLVFFGALKLKAIMRFHVSQSVMLTGLIELSSLLDNTCLALFFFIKNCHTLTAPFTCPDCVVLPPLTLSAICSLVALTASFVAIFASRQFFLVA